MFLFWQGRGPSGIANYPHDLKVGYNIHVRRTRDPYLNVLSEVFRICTGLFCYGVLPLLSYQKKWIGTSIKGVYVDGMPWELYCRRSTPGGGGGILGIALSPGQNDQPQHPPSPRFKETQIRGLAQTDYACPPANCVLFQGLKIELNADPWRTKTRCIVTEKPQKFFPRSPERREPRILKSMSFLIVIFGTEYGVVETVCMTIVWWCS